MPKTPLLTSAISHPRNLFSKDKLQFYSSVTFSVFQVAVSLPKFSVTLLSFHSC